MSALAGGASSTGSTSLTIPAGTPAGTYYIIAKADADGAVAETQEGNNTFARSVQIGPDLAISALTVPATAGPGAGVVVTDTTRNQGADTAGPSTTRFYFSTNVVLDVADPPLDGNRPVPALAAGASSTGSTSLAIPAGTPAGTYYIIAKADADGLVPEGQESNNTVWRAIKIE